MDTTSFTKKSIGLETVEPALTPPTKIAPANFAKKTKIGTGKSKTKKRDIPEGLWTKCPTCETMIFDKELDENLKVCPKCNHHFPIGSRERIHSLVETCTFEEMDAGMTSVDMLGFKGAATYKSKLEAYKKNTTLKDAVLTGLCKIGEHRVALGVMDFDFLGGSMGSVVGEKLTRLIERGTEKESPVVIISTSGGARMYEGNVQPDADGENLGRARVSRAGKTALHQRAHASDNGRRDGQLRDARRSDPGRAGRDDRIRRAASHQGHDAGGTAAGISDRRIPARPRAD
jgi:hypothetical protein